MVLVTGATGFLGSELVSRLTGNGTRVRAVKRKDSVIPGRLKGHNSIEWVTADLLDYFSLEEALAGADRVYHCAAMVSFHASDKIRMMCVNQEGTANLVNACLEKGIGKLLHVSSVAAIGDAKPGKLITETDRWEFNSSRSTYATSKYAAEMEVFRGIAEGLRAVIINPSVILGRDTGSDGSGRLFEAVRKGLRFYPSGSCGFTDVEDVAKAAIALMEGPHHSERFIVNAENCSYRELFQDIALEMGLEPPRREVKSWMLRLALPAARIAGFLSGKKPALSADIVRSTGQIQAYSNSKITAAIGIRFKPLRQTISEICGSLPAALTNN